MSAEVQPGQNAPAEALDRISSRLTGVGFSVERSVPVQPYFFNILGHRVITGSTARGAQVPWSNVVAVISINDPSPNDVASYSAWVMKFALANRGSLNVRRNSLSTIAVILCSGPREDTKQWLSQSLPSYSLMWGRAEFPVLVGLDNREVFYCKRIESGAGIPRLYQALQNHADEWFGFPPVDENSRSMVSV